jgi:DHA2 family multidrug resistance protein
LTAQLPMPRVADMAPFPATSVEEARGVGPASPPITTHPFIGILGVFLGALTATLNGRLVSVGLPDLRGALGAGIDEASWIPTMLNMGIMFIGVFGVFLGAAYGVRRVLMISGAIFTLTSLLLPLSQSLAVMLVLQAIAGLSSGSFYSLTLTFVARSLPPKLLVFGIAAYALDIVVTSNMAALLEGVFTEYSSWHWIFWTAAVLTPFVMICLYFGVPPPPETAKSQPKPNWRGFLYLSLGLSLIYGALDQGERLDWLHSGLIAGMFAGGIFLILATLARRYLQPNPFVNLPFLNARNILILGLGVFLIRFALLSSLMMIPAFLANVQQYRAIQTGRVLGWVAAPQFVLVWLVAIAAVFIQPRIVMAAGFATIAVACWMAANLDSSWAGGSFVIPELLLAAGIAAAFVGLVISLLVLALEMGAITNIANAATFSGCMHTMRLLGGQIGAVLLARFLTVREHFHSNILGQNVDAGNWMTTERLGALTAALGPSSSGGSEAQARSVGVLSAQIRAQSYTLACSDAFLLIAWSIAAYLLLLTFLRRSTIDLRHAGKAQ